MVGIQKLGQNVIDGYDIWYVGAYCSRQCLH